MVAVGEIGWGSYKEYEGPYYLGRHRFTLPPNPSEDHKLVAVITATEGGAFDAYNGYDRCKCSSGLIQWCEARMFGVSGMLGAVVEKLGRSALSPLLDFLGTFRADFQQDLRGRWRFRLGSDIVDTDDEQNRLLFLRSNGKKGTWDTASREHARRFAAAVSTVWESPAAAEVQLQYTAQRVLGFRTPFAKSVFPPELLEGNAWARAAHAAYISFAANNPTWASQSLQVARAETGASPESAEGVTTILRYLTFHKGITIYPHRYNKIRPVVEQLYGVELPDFAEELKFKQRAGALPTKLWDTLEVQKALLYLGYDLGPAGADGRWGAKTTEALRSFEETEKTIPRAEVDGKMDRRTAGALAARLGPAYMTNHT